MNYEQINLYGNKECFKATGKNLEELEKDAKNEILKNKISNFIDKNKKNIDKIIKMEGELGALNIHELARRFTGNAGDEEISSAGTLFARILAKGGYKLNSAVIRAEIKGKDGSLLEKKARTGQKKQIPCPTLNPKTVNEIKKARAKLPPHQRGLPNADL